MTTPLTKDYIIKNGLSGIDLIKYFNPEWTDNECDFYLWEFTTFPFSPIENLITQLNNKFIKT